MAENRTFSESWYRVANQRISLRAHAQCHRQMFRGQEWYVVRDPFTNRFFRLRPAAYEFVARLRSTRTVQETWEECVELSPDDAPGQEDVIQLLAQLYHANLLHYDVPADSAKLFERYKSMRQRETTAKLLNVMFAHFPLLDPDAFLVRLMPLARLVIGPLGALVWLAVVGFALKLGIEDFPALRQQSQGVLSAGNLPLLYAALVVLKAAHEFGHAFACRRFGGEVHTMGVMLLIFTPLPYMDATSSWSFRSRWKRVFVGAAGILVEVFAAGCATLVWAKTAPGTVHSLAYNVIFIASVSTLLFNGNPLLRFDGYYILSDLIDIPNLHQQCWRHLTHLVERYAFGYRKSYSPAESWGEAAWLLFYGLASRVYRIFVFVRILLFVADRFLLAGIIMFGVCIVSWLVVPTSKFVRSLLTSPHLDRSRPRAIAVSAAVVTALVLSLYYLPYPDRFRAPGVVEAGEFADVIAESPGAVAQILTPSGQLVRSSQPLIRLHNPDLARDIALTQARLAENAARLRLALAEMPADTRSVRGRIRVIERELALLEFQQNRLIVTAPRDGVWVSPTLDEMQGVWLDRGTGIGHVLDTSAFRFAAVVTQEEASRLFADEIVDAQVRVRGCAHVPVEVTSRRVIPAEQTVLPSAALGWFGGGDVAVDVQSAGGRKTVEPFFEVRTSLAAPPEQLVLLHGRSGKIRFELPPRSLLAQWYRKARQLLQKRYQI